MNDQEINKDRQERVKKAKEEIQAILNKYELAIVAEDMIGEHTSISVQTAFRDVKQYSDAALAQPVNPVVEQESQREANPTMEQEARKDVHEKIHGSVESHIQPQDIFGPNTPIGKKKK